MEAPNDCVQPVEGKAWADDFGSTLEACNFPLEFPLVNWSYSVIVSKPIRINRRGGVEFTQRL